MLVCSRKELRRKKGNTKYISCTMTQGWVSLAWQKMATAEYLESGSLRCEVYYIMSGGSLLQIRSIAPINIKNSCETLKIRETTFSIILILLSLFKYVLELPVCVLTRSRTSIGTSISMSLYRSMPRMKRKSSGADISQV